MGLLCVCVRRQHPGPEAPQAGFRQPLNSLYAKQAIGEVTGHSDCHSHPGLCPKLVLLEQRGVKLGEEVPGRGLMSLVGFLAILVMLGDSSRAEESAPSYHS